MFKLKIVAVCGLLTFPLAAAVEYKVTSGVEYSRPDGVSVLLDAHVPEGKGPFPAVILVHGGGWTQGDRTAKFIQPLFKVLDQTGFAWFTIDYRLAPQYAYPAAADDVETAVAVHDRPAGGPGRLAEGEQGFERAGLAVGEHLAFLGACRARGIGRVRHPRGRTEHPRPSSATPAPARE